MKNSFDKYFITNNNLPKQYYFHEKLFQLFVKDLAPIFEIWFSWIFFIFKFSNE